jgi:hydroxymethylpyrimidine pyrophosphatase-like HAD family hydrolase
MMELAPEHINQLETFFNNSKFSTHGAVITDLDGTAVHEYNGKIIIHTSVELGLKKMHHLGRPIIINTLRFPLSVIHTFGKEWYTISNAPIPVILLNGSQLGHIVQSPNGNFVFKQMVSFTLTEPEIDTVLKGVSDLIEGGIHNIVFFYYPEDWTAGEIIWTPDEKRIPQLQKKYLSASSVISTSQEKLRNILLSQKLCMIFLLIEAEADKLMAYQHSKKNNFFTTAGIDKLSGTKEMAKLLGADLAHSIGAGDTEMDNFLKGVGLSVHIGNGKLPFRGSSDTIKLPGFTEFGQLLFHFAEMQQNKILQ